MSIPIKLVTLGESGVGKTSVINRYITGSFPESSKPTIGAAFITKEVKFGNETYNLMIWDTAGQEEYRGLAPMYYRNASIAIVMFDIVSRPSFEAVDYWLKDLKDNAGPDIGVLLCANKMDLQEDRFQGADFLEFSKDHNVVYVETSALTGEGIDLLFEQAIKLFIKNKNQPIPPNPGNQINNKKRKKSTCC